MFVYLTRDDPGSSHGFASAAGDGDGDGATRAAIASLRPKRAAFAPTAPEPPVLHEACELPGDDVVKTSARVAGGGPRWAALSRTGAAKGDFTVTFQLESG